VGVVLLLAVVGFFLLRNQLFAPEAATETASVVTTEEAAQSTPAPVLVVVTATLAEATASTGPTFAPACSADVTFPAPVAKETDNFCVQKIPYAYAMMSESSTYNVLNTDGSKCRVEAVKNGEKVISCTGPSFAVVEVEVCSAIELSSNDLAQCSADNTYNSANQCCVAAPPEKAACKTIKIQLKGCGG
jgi:hypothetical protein